MFVRVGKESPAIIIKSNQKKPFYIDILLFVNDPNRDSILHSLDDKMSPCAHFLFQFCSFEIHLRVSQRQNPLGRPKEAIGSYLSGWIDR